MKADDFDEVWLVDFEYHGADNGGRPVPVCMVAREYRSGRYVRLWGDELRRYPWPPFGMGRRQLYVAYNAAAEFGCHLALGWPLPENTLDLYVEFRAWRNGLGKPPGGFGLIGASTVFGVSHIAAATKQDMRDLILSGGPWDADDRKAILDYCQTDVDALADLLPHFLRVIPHLGHAVLRGRYMRAIACMVDTGVPVDVATHSALVEHWDSIKRHLVESVDHGGVYDGTSFRSAQFERFLVERNVPWPRLASGKLDLSRDAFRDMGRSYPVVEPIRQLRNALSELRLNDLEIGPDGRNRTSLWPFASVTGRNQPSSSKFVFGPSRWVRSLIKPTEGSALAYIDYSQQEIGIAAALSGDSALAGAYQSGDSYLAFAQQAGAAPAGSTKATHGAVRAQYKACALATQYGMTEFGLALRIGKAPIDARHLLAIHRRVYRRFWDWSDAMCDVAQLTGRISTRYGWPLHMSGDTRERTVRNWPMQAHGAEILRLALCYATEAGIKVCAPVHDAVLIEAPVGEIDDHVARTQWFMAKAGRDVLKGFELRTDVDITRHPDRYVAEGGEAMWQTVMDALPAGSRVAPGATWSHR